MSPTVHQRRWLLTLMGLTDASKLAVVFADSGATIVRTELRVGQEVQIGARSNCLRAETPRTAGFSASGARTSTAELPSRELRTFEFDPRSIASNSVAVLEVAYADEAPEIAALYWESREGTGPWTPIGVREEHVPSRHRRALTELDRAADPARPAQDTVLGGILRDLTPASVEARVVPELFRDLVTDFLPGPTRHELRRLAEQDTEQARSFFRDLDITTSQRVLPSGLVASLMAVNGRLGARVDMRSTERAEAPGGTLDLPFSRRFERQLQDVSSFMQSMILTRLYRSDGSCLLDWAFECFVLEKLAVTSANGAIDEVLHAQGAPDGGAFYRFPELALACIEYGVDAPFWKRHVAGLVQAGALYLAQVRATSGSGAPVFTYREGRALSRPGQLRVKADFQRFLAMGESEREQMTPEVVAAIEGLQTRTVRAAFPPSAGKDRGGGPGAGEEATLGDGGLAGHKTAELRAG